MQKRTVVVIAVVWMMIIVAIGSSAVTLMVVSNANGEGNYLVGEKVYEQIERYARLEDIRTMLNENYYIPVDDDALMLGAIRGMMDALEDPYTFYYTAEEMKKSNEQSEGIYHGVGMIVQITDEGYIEIVHVYDNSPAAVAGVRAGDKMIAVDDAPVSGENAKTLNEAVALVRGEDGTTVDLKILRGGEEMTLTLTRAEVNISYVDYQIIDGNIGYVNISQFTGNDVTGFKQAVDAFQQAGVGGMVVDLRNNPGGLLTDVVEIADMLLPKGTIVSIVDRNGNRDEKFSDADYWDIPLVVLVNGASASASELFTAAIQDYARGTVIGTTTYGKGIVQTLLNFESDGAGMQLTTASYYSPNGRSIHKVGVEPDIVLELNEGVQISGINPDPTKDNQLNAALIELKRMMSKAA